MKKVKTILKEGVGKVKRAHDEGKLNYENPTPQMERLARERLETCNCLEPEPIDFFKVKDERIPEFSDAICKECGCPAAYKFRQNILKCKKWRK